LDHSATRTEITTPILCQPLMLLCQRFEGEHTKKLMHPFWPCLNVLDHDGHRLIVRRLFGRAKVLS